MKEKLGFLEKCEIEMQKILSDFDEQLEQL